MSEPDDSADIYITTANKTYCVDADTLEEFAEHDFISVKVIEEIHVKHQEQCNRMMATKRDDNRPRVSVYEDDTGIDLISVMANERDEFNAIIIAARKLVKDGIPSDNSDILKKSNPVKIKNNRRKYRNVIKI